MTLSHTNTIEIYAYAKVYNIEACMQSMCACIWCTIEVVLDRRSLTVQSIKDGDDGPILKASSTDKQL